MRARPFFCSAIPAKAGTQVKFYGFIFTLLILDLSPGFACHCEPKKPESVQSCLAAAEGRRLEASGKRTLVPVAFALNDQEFGLALADELRQMCEALKSREAIFDEWLAQARPALESLEEEENDEASKILEKIEGKDWRMTDKKGVNIFPLQAIDRLLNSQEDAKSLAQVREEKLDEAFGLPGGKRPASGALHRLTAKIKSIAQDPIEKTNREFLIQKTKPPRKNKQAKEEKKKK